MAKIRFLIQFETGNQVIWVQNFEKKKFKNPKEIVKIKEAKVV